MLDRRPYADSCCIVIESIVKASARALCSGNNEIALDMEMPIKLLIPDSVIRWILHCTVVFSETPCTAAWHELKSETRKVTV